MQNDRQNPQTIWQDVLNAVYYCLTSNWVTSDHRRPTLWKHIQPHWAEFVIDFEPTVPHPNPYIGDNASREQCLNWLLMNFDKASTFLNEQGFVHKLLVHMDTTNSDHLLFSDLKMMFVCLRMHPERIKSFKSPMLENGLEDMAEMVSCHHNEQTATFTHHVLITRPIGPSADILMKFFVEYNTMLSQHFPQFFKYYNDTVSSRMNHGVDPGVDPADDMCSSDSRDPNEDEDDYHWNDDEFPGALMAGGCKSIPR
ncbi:hypothetical protein BLNAU_23681 [Blattamonas nauphoetae]|uniref:Uncharacterized protein n=1 Tax=Blattamonas nauphoetae TaxID=2049346 RepID=A0ABQ9WQ09_9EUKA|nr:hypothetical protein BLNAU_23681 [Blattamonas nauphoetae]